MIITVAGLRGCSGASSSSGLKDGGIEYKGLRNSNRVSEYLKV